MSTKKIWTISIVLGLSMAIFAYLSIFSKGKNTSEIAAAKVSQQTNIKNTSNNKVEKMPIPQRNFKNPIVEVSKGERAISIKINSPEQGVSGFVEPNSRVDVIGYEQSKGNNTTNRNAELIVENVKVLAAGKSSDSQDSALLYDMVTLEVTPEQGVLLSLASKEKDGFYLMMRNSRDEEIGKTGLKQTRELLGGN